MGDDKCKSPIFALYADTEGCDYRKNGVLRRAVGVEVWPFIPFLSTRTRSPLYSAAARPQFGNGEREEMKSFCINSQGASVFIVRTRQGKVIECSFRSVCPC
jgi:hypothetical protein